MQKLIATMAVFAVVIIAPAGAGTGPFGVEWGSSVEEAAKRLPEAEIERSADGEGVSFTATAISKDAEFAFAMTSKDPASGAVGVSKILINSHEFEDDPQAISVLLSAQRLRDLLTEKYGAPVSVIKFADGFNGEFRALGLLTGNSTWAHKWIVGDTGVYLMVIRLGDDANLRWSLFYEYLPLKNVLRKEIDKNAHDAL